jgi:hypothetical protein
MLLRGFPVKLHGDPRAAWGGRGTRIEIEYSEGPRNAPFIYGVGSVVKRMRGACNTA